MKNSIYIMMLMSLFFYGCAQDELILEQEESQETYTVSLKFNGDIQAEETPLSRAETDSRDLYCIQVYRDGNNFAAGMFDNPNNITINLKAGSSYRFVCTAIKEGKDICYYDSSYGYGYYDWYSYFRNNKIYYTYYYGALSYRGSSLLRICNSFDYETGYRFEYLSSPEIWIKNGSGRSLEQCVPIDRFYGELDNYTPSVNGVVNLVLKRVSFGVKINVYNIKEGKVTVSCENNHNTFVSASNLNTDYESETKIFSMTNIYDAWKYADTGYTESLTLTVKWDREGGLITDTWTKTIQVKRNAMNTIRIKMSTDEKGDVGVGVTPEGGEMGGEEEEIPLG